MKIRNINQLFFILFLTNTYPVFSQHRQELSEAIISTTSNTIQWGVNIHDGGSNPQNMADKLDERSLKFVRMDYWGKDPVYLTKFKNAVQIMTAKNIKVQAIVFSAFSRGQSRSEDYLADLAEVEQTVYNDTKPQIESIKDWVLDYELQNEIPLYPNMNVTGSAGQNASDYNTQAGRLQSAVLRGMYRAIDDVRKKHNLSIRVILGTVDRRFGFLSYMQQQGVFFDVVGYHIYPWEKHATLDQDPWFGLGGPLGQLASFNKPIHINEFNSGEIYSGASYMPGTSYENQGGKLMTETGYKGLYKHLNAIVNQKVANVEAVYFYEAHDETNKGIPENRFGLYYDTDLQEPKTSLLIATAFAGGELSTSEKDSLTKRGFTYYNTFTGIFEKNIDAGISIRIYPNIVKDYLTIRSSAPLSLIQVYNYSGVQMIHKELAGSNNNFEIDLSSLMRGVYLVKTNTMFSSAVKLIMKL